MTIGRLPDTISFILGTLSNFLDTSSFFLRTFGSFSETLRDLLHTFSRSLDTFKPKINCPNLNSRVAKSLTSLLLTLNALEKLKSVG